MKMQAMVMTGHGGPEVLEFKEVEAPTIRGPHDVLVRVRAAGVNPADWQLRRRPFAGYVKEQNPDGLILGLDGAGVVEAVGSAVTRFTPTRYTTLMAGMDRRAATPSTKWSTSITWPPSPDRSTSIRRGLRLAP
jgi:NADPH:quinone reductase-like Zn-dependent oxidoreductase